MLTRVALVFIGVRLALPVPLISQPYDSEHPPAGVPAATETSFASISGDVADGDFMLMEWWFAWELPEAIYVVGEVHLIINPGVGVDLEDFTVWLHSPGLGCKLVTRHPMGNSPGVRIGGSIGASISGPSVGVSVSTSVGQDGTWVDMSRKQGEDVKWEVDIDDTSSTASDGAELDFYAEWSCPKSLQIASLVSDGKRGVDLRFEMDTDALFGDPNYYWNHHRPGTLYRWAAGGDVPIFGFPGGMLNDRDEYEDDSAELDVFPREEEVATATAPPGSEILTPAVAFAGGTITGTVTDEQGEPVAGAPVQVTTISGTVTETQTDEEGQFTSDVPAGGIDPLQVVVAGIVTAATIALVSEIPSDIPAQPPAFVEPGQTVTVNGNYPTVEMEPPPETAPPTPAEPVAETPGQPAQPAEPSGAEPASFNPRSLPVAQAISADGTQAITSYRVPQDFIPGRSITVLTNSEGQTYRYETEMFRIVSASIDRDHLRSGQDTEFRYRFDFGPGPERDVWLTINTAGPITYTSAGERQRLHINADGSAEFVGKLKAQRGGLTGTPFTINATIDR